MRSFFDLSNPESGILRVGASITACQYIVPAALREFRESFPAYSLRITPGDGPLVTQSLLDGSIDLGIVVRQHRRSKLAYHELFSDELGFLVSPLHPWARAEGLLLLDDLLLAQTERGDTAVSTIHLISPDPQTKYRISTAVPAAAQKLPVEAVAAAHMQTITLWLDDARLATLTNPPYRVWWPLTPGVHTMWAEGVDEGGTAVQSEAITFEVLEAIQLSN